MHNQTFQLKRKRLADQVADHLMALIAGGELKPGDRLPPEPELMKQFQVGRSSIREAIGALSLVGLVSVKAGQGTHVTGFSGHGFMQAPGAGMITAEILAGRKPSVDISSLSPERFAEGALVSETNVI